MELMQAVEHYATASKLADAFGNKFGDMDAANNAWHECKKAADEIERLREERNQDRIAAGHRLALELECLLLDTKDDEAKQLRAFAQGVMRYWPEGAPDGGALQDLAEKHGLLKPEKRNAPCGEGCACAEYVDSQEWGLGVTCYQKTPLLTGTNAKQSPFPASIEN